MVPSGDVRQVDRRAVRGLVVAIKATQQVKIDVGKLVALGVIQCY
jgi:CRISPR/Cas system-associated exonuclease Cas4 (RecB family)